LIVDDDPEIVGMLTSVLGDEGYEVEPCIDSRDAVRRVEELHPAALLLDIRMPEVDGWAVLRAVRKTLRGRTLPVILMSGAWRPHERHREIGGTLRLDPTIVLPKPFALQDLDVALRRFGVVPR
jgi:CheY-like chemotaxis protein